MIFSKFSIFKILYLNFNLGLNTTRKARPNEVDGVDYHFINEQKFKVLLNENFFYEHSIIFGNYYGTSKSAVDDIVKKKCNVLFDIDWKGAKQLSEFKELNLLKIFILEIIKPGDTQLTVIFFLAYSIAKLLDIPIIPAFEAE